MVNDSDRLQIKDINVSKESVKNNKTRFLKDMDDSKATWRFK